jgi:hypothetical protein
MIPRSRVFQVVLGTILVGIGIWLWGIVKGSGGWEKLFSSDVQYSSPRRLPAGVQVGKIKLTQKFSRTIDIDPAIGENVVYRLVRGPFNGQKCINGKILPVVLPNNPRDPKKIIDETTCSIAWRNLVPENPLEPETSILIYCIYIGEEPKNWETEALLIDL